MTIEEKFAEFMRALRPSGAQLDLAKAELDFLESKLSEFVADDDDFRLVKVLRSGSYAKNTLLKRHESGDFDADVAIYFAPREEAEAPEVESLLDLTEKLLRKAYKDRTTRTPEFDRSPKSAVRVSFKVNPRINIDAVPVINIEHKSIPNWGAIPRRDGEFRNTSVTEHIGFITERNKAKNAIQFNELVMLCKWWRNHALHADLHDKFSSFALELLAAKAFDETKSKLTGDRLSDLLEIGTWLIRHRLTKPISFPDPRVPAAKQKVQDRFVVLDPMNLDNNVAHNWTDADVQVLLGKIGQLCDVIQDAKNEVESEEVHAAALFLDQMFPNFSNWSEAT